MQRSRLLAAAGRVAAWALAWAAFSGCDEPYDWCSEAQAADASEASGRVLLRYEGSVSPGGVVEVEIEPYILFVSGGLTVQGCRKHRGDLWRWRGTLTGLVPGASEQQVAASGDGAAYGGEVRMCEGGSCTVENLKNVAISGDQSRVSGVIAEYDPAAATLRGVLHVTNARDELVDIAIDIQWDAPSP